MPQAIRALLAQLIGLDFDQAGLLVEIGAGLFGQGRIVPGGDHRRRRRRRVEAYGERGFPAFGRLLAFAPQERAHRVFRHLSPDGCTAQPPPSWP
jgi:hypothetical protein